MPNDHGQRCPNCDILLVKLWSNHPLDPTKIQAYGCQKCGLVTHFSTEDDPKPD